MLGTGVLAMVGALPGLPNGALAQEAHTWTSKYLNHPNVFALAWGNPSRNYVEDLGFSAQLFNNPATCPTCTALFNHDSLRRTGARHYRNLHKAL